MNVHVTPPQSPKQFYRRELPAGCIEFSSEEGKQVFKEALSSGHMDCYFKLAAQFRTQDEPAFCGLSTLVMVLNSLSVDPGRVWKGPWRWYHESMLDCCMSLQLVKKQGITFDNFVCLAECNFLITQPVRAEENFSEGKPRGYIQLSRHFDFTPLLLFRISPQLSVTFSQGLSSELTTFMNFWLQWLSEPADADKDQESIVQQAVLEVLKWASFLSETASILTSQLDVKCPELVSEGHLCAVKDMMESLEKLDIFPLLSLTLCDFVATKSKEVVQKVCRAAGIPNCMSGNVQCCELMKLLTPAHFFSILLLSWPYKVVSKSEMSNAAKLQDFADKHKEQVSGVLQNEISALMKQLKTILKLYKEDNLCTCR
ncbi:uncharacterized protein LOC135462046 isoform X2 [Liolophura sinensis]|uniref:uncharacterized protein LOC135462046 isoform X2 n=1 Tax=Liolophura sinensis TaxID=3198878 RepID=UPI0031590B67